MRVFEIRLNKKRLCVAGIGEDGVLSTILSQVVGNGRDEVDLHVGGLDSKLDEHVSWIWQRVQNGDEVTIRVKDSRRADKPSKRTRRDPAKDKQDIKRYVRKMAKEFGWQVVARPKTRHR
jgi:hypothetical protein